MLHIKQGILGESMTLALWAAIVRAVDRHLTKERGDLFRPPAMAFHGDKAARAGYRPRFVIGNAPEQCGKGSRAILHSRHPHPLFQSLHIDDTAASICLLGEGGKACDLA